MADADAAGAEGAEALRPVRHRDTHPPPDSTEGAFPWRRCDTSLRPPGTRRQGVSETWVDRARRAMPPRVCCEGRRVPPLCPRSPRSYPRAAVPSVPQAALQVWKAEGLQVPPDASYSSFECKRRARTVALPPPHQPKVSSRLVSRAASTRQNFTCMDEEDLVAAVAKAGLCPPARAHARALSWPAATPKPAGAEPRACDQPACLACRRPARRSRRSMWNMSRPSRQRPWRQRGSSRRATARRGEGGRRPGCSCCDASRGLLTLLALP